MRIMGYLPHDKKKEHIKTGKNLPPVYFYVANGFECARISFSESSQKLIVYFSSIVIDGTYVKLRGHADVTEEIIHKYLNFISGDMPFIQLDFTSYDGDHLFELYAVNKPDESTMIYIYDIPDWDCDREDLKPYGICEYHYFASQYPLGVYIERNRLAVSKFVRTIQFYWEAKVCGYPDGYKGSLTFYADKVSIELLDLYKDKRIFTGESKYIEKDDYGYGTRYLKVIRGKGKYIPYIAIVFNGVDAESNSKFLVIFDITPINYNPKWYINEPFKISVVPIEPIKECETKRIANVIRNHVEIPFILARASVVEGDEDLIHD